MTIIVAIVTSFNPNLEALKNLLESIEHQVKNIVVVDNGSPEKSIQIIKNFIPDNTTLIEKGHNSGVSEAINTGVVEAKTLRASHLVLFDQDSVPAGDMIEHLMASMAHKKGEGIKLAGCGPQYTDVKGYQTNAFTKLVGRRLKEIECSDHETVFVDHLITSGCLISMDAMDDVGPMEQQLFIDYVDIEWCHRATNKGYMLLGVGAAKMQHDLGEDVVNFFGRTILLHSALRYYYLIRNGVWMLKHPVASRDWKVMNAIRLLKIYVTLSLFVGTRFSNWKMMTKGLCDAFCGRMGRYRD